MKIILIEDDNSIRKGIKILLSRYAPSFILEAEAATVAEGYQLIAERKPEVLLLDIQLTDGSSFDIITQLHNRFPNYKPKLIFITAYQEYAIKALKCSALDYLLKPIDPLEFKQAIAKLNQSTKDSYPQVEVFLDHLNPPNQHKKITLHTQTQTYIVPINQIIRCESDVNYTKIYIEKGKTILMSKTLKYFDELLQTYGFERIHQSHLVNIAFMKTHHKNTGTLELTNGNQLPIATRKREMINKLLDFN